MVTGSLARRYAKAVLQIGNQSDQETVAKDLRTLSGAMTASGELVAVVTNPAIRRSDRKKVITAILDRVAAQPTTRNLVYLLLDGERLSSLPAISRELDAMLEARRGRISATVTSARPLDAKQLADITAALEALSQKKVDVTKREDPALLGGVVAQLGDVVYDGSLRTQIRMLRDDLIRGPAAER